MLSGLSDKNESLENSEKVKIHKELSYAYFKFIRKIIVDFIPKRIKHKMVNAFINSLDTNLYEKIFQKYLLENKTDTILSREDENFEEDRQDAKKKLDAVKKALSNMIDIQYF